MTTETQQTTNNPEEQMQIWVRERFQECNKYLAEKGILADKVLVDESRYMAPLVALWKVKARDRKVFWVITGQLPADHVPATIASDPRDVLRHFSMSWQLKADAILNAEQQDPVQQKFAALLIQRAEALYQLFNDDKYWQSAP